MSGGGDEQSHEVVCVLTKNPWFSVFFRISEEVELRRRVSIEEAESFLENLDALPFPEPVSVA